MSQADRDKWNLRYAEGAYSERLHPAAFLAERVPEIVARQRAERSGGEPLRALDLACGAGRNAFFLASVGYDVDAVDVSVQALDRARSQANKHPSQIRWFEHDLDKGLPSGLPLYDLAIMIRYLDTVLLKHAARQLRPGGVLICEVHLATEEPVAGPSGAAFRARSGELRDAVPELETISYWEGLTRDPDNASVALARLVARRT